VMSFQASSAVGLAISAWRRSPGSLCTTPPGTRGLLTGPRSGVRSSPITSEAWVFVIHRPGVKGRCTLGSATRQPREPSFCADRAEWGISPTDLPPT
jgi:hypothetical protein